MGERARAGRAAGASAGAALPAGERASRRGPLVSRRRLLGAAGLALLAPAALLASGRPGEAGASPAFTAFSPVGAWLPATYCAPTGAAVSCTVRVARGYLALRSAPFYDESNELGALYTGDVVETDAPSDVAGADGEPYWWVYAPRLQRWGYVNRRYLEGADKVYAVSVARGYLALRSAPAYDESNELGALYTGDVVEAAYAADPVYWWVYAPRLGLAGYVNCNYLVGAAAAPAPSPTARTVSVARGYLALRSAPAYDESNELGALYTGEAVYYLQPGPGPYWYVFAPTLGACGYVNSRYLR